MAEVVQIILTSKCLREQLLNIILEKHPACLREDTLGMTDNIIVSGNYITLITHLTSKHAFLQEASFACFIIHNEEQVYTYNRSQGMSSNIVYDMNV